MLKFIFKKLGLIFGLFIFCFSACNVSAWSRSDIACIKCYNDLKKLSSQYEKNDPVQSCITYILERWWLIIKKVESEKSTSLDNIYENTNAGGADQSDEVSYLADDFWGVLEDDLIIREKWYVFVYWELCQKKFEKYFNRVLNSIYNGLCAECEYCRNYDIKSPDIEMFIRKHRNIMFLDRRQYHPVLNYPIVCFGESKKGVWWCIVKEDKIPRVVKY